MQSVLSTSHDDSPPDNAIDAARLFAALASDKRVAVLDVREGAVIDRSGLRFPEAIEIPSHELFVRRRELPLGRVDLLVVIAAEPGRARAAAFTLSLLGFAAVRALEGGIQAWADKGFPTV